MSLQHRLSELVHALTHPPYYLIRPPQSSPTSWQEASAEAYLLEALSLGTDEPPKKLISTKVRLNANATLVEDQVTRHSRTSLALEPHTDSSNQQNPHSIVIFGMSRPDASGGLTQLISVDDIVTELDAQTIDLLSKRIWPIGQTPKAILKNHPVLGITISYYKKQLERTLELGATLSPEQVTALQQLDHCIDTLSSKNPIQLKAGETAIINNHKVLHGRTALSQDTRRLMFRYRLKVTFEVIQRLLVEPPEIATPTISHAADRCCHILESQGRSAQFNLISAWAGLSKASKNPTVSNDGQRLFKQGRFSEAKAALEQSLSREPEHFTSNYLLSAIATRAKDPDTAKAYLTAAARAEPFRGRSRIDDHRHTILKLRSFEGARVAPKKMSNGRYTTRLKGAQISTKSLIDKERFQLILGNISSQSPVDVEPPRCDLIFNGISDIDASPGAWKMVSALVDQWSGIPIINHPQFLSNTTRDAVANICNSIDGLKAGVTKRYDSTTLTDPAKLVKDVESEFDYPVLTRTIGTHTGATLQKSDTSAELSKALHQLDNRRDIYVTQYVDSRSDDSSFQKIRCFFVDGRPYPVCNIRSLHWEIRNRSRFLPTSSNKGWIDEEAYSMEHFAEYMGKDRLSALSALHEHINLDLFGVDFALLSSGEILVFEANVAMRHNYDYVELAPQIKPAHDRVGAAFNEMVASRINSTQV